MAGYYNAESLLRGTPVPQMDVSSVISAGKFANDAFNQFRQNEIAVASNKLKRDQLAQQKELAMLPYDMQQQATDRANQLITMSQNEIANSNPNADKFFNELYANVQNDQDLANANQKLFTALGGQKDSTGYVNLDPTKLNQFNTLVEGTDQEKAIRTRDAIIRNALAQGVDPNTANTLATNEYNRLYGTQAATNQKVIEEQLKSLDDAYKLQLEYGIGKPKTGEGSTNISINGLPGIGGNQINSSTLSGTNTRDIASLTESINARFDAGNDFTSFGTTPKDITQLAIKAQSIDPTLNNDQILKALDLITSGQADKFFKLDPNVPLSANNETDVLKLAQLAKSTGPSTTNFSDSTRAKGLTTDAENQAQISTDRLKSLNEITNAREEARRQLLGQLSPASSYTELSNFVNKAQPQTGVNATISNIDYSQDLNNINTDRFAQIVSNIESKGDYGAENYKSDGTINAAGKYQFVQSTLNQTLKNMGLPNMTLKEFQKNPQLQEAAFKQLTNDNAKFLKTNNLGVNPFNLWMVHNLGASQTKNFADINSPLSDETKSAIWANLPKDAKEQVKSKDNVTRDVYIQTYGNIFNADINQFTQPTSTGNGQVNQNTDASTSERIQQLFANVNNNNNNNNTSLVEQRKSLFDTLVGNNKAKGGKSFIDLTSNQTGLNNVNKINIPTGTDVDNFFKGTPEKIRNSAVGQSTLGQLLLGKDLVSNAEKFAQTEAGQSIVSKGILTPEQLTREEKEYIKALQQSPNGRRLLDEYSKVLTNNLSVK